MALCKEEEDEEDYLPKWLQEELDEELRIFRFVLPSTFPISALSYPLAGASPAPSPQTFVLSPPSVEFRVTAVGRHLQHIRGAIGIELLVVRFLLIIRDAIATQLPTFILQDVKCGLLQRFLWSIYMPITPS